MKKINLQKYALEFDGGQYCNFSAAASRAIAGKDILLAVFNLDGSKLLAISGQQSLTLNRTKDSIEITSKDTVGGWKSKIAGMKEWSIDNDGIYIADDESHKILSNAFEDDTPLCIKIVNLKTQKGLFGGLATLTDYSLEAPYDDSMTYSTSLEGMGALVDLSENPPVPDTMPSGENSLEGLTVVSVAGTSGKTKVYVNPIKEGSNTYKYQTGESVTLPKYDDDVSMLTDWNGEDEIEAVSGNKILIVECENNKARKAGTATVTAGE